MRENLRKVIFNLNEFDLTIGDLEYEDSEGIMDERYGYFHRFGDVIVYDSYQERYLQKAVAIIEEIDTGKVYELAPRCIRFVKSIDN